MGKKDLKPVLCDSNILFRFLHGDKEIRRVLMEIGDERIAFPVIVVAEAYAGSGNAYFTRLKLHFTKYKVYPFTEDTSKIFIGIIQSHHKRHSKWIPDAIIAAIAINNNLELYTLNKKDFDFIDNLNLYKPS